MNQAQISEVIVLGFIALLVLAAKFYRPTAAICNRLRHGALDEQGHASVLRNARRRRPGPGPHE